MSRRFFQELFRRPRPRRHRLTVAAAIERFEQRCLLANVSWVSVSETRIERPEDVSGPRGATPAANGGVGLVSLDILVNKPPARYAIEFNGVAAKEFTYVRPRGFQEGDYEQDSQHFGEFPGHQFGLVWGNNTAVVRDLSNNSVAATSNFYIGAPQPKEVGNATISPAMPVIGQDIEVVLTGEQFSDAIQVTVLRSPGPAEDEGEDPEDVFYIETEGVPVAYTDLEITSTRISFRIPASEPVPPGTYVVTLAFPPSLDLTPYVTPRTEQDRLTRNIIARLGGGEPMYRSAGFLGRTFKIPAVDPVITELDPMEVEVGVGDVTFTIRGAGFYQRAGHFSGSDVFLVDPDHEVAPGQLRTIRPRFRVIDFNTIEVKVSSSLLEESHRLDVFVLNPESAGTGTSNVERLVLKPPTPRIVSLSDLVATAGATAKTIQIIGEGFEDSIIHWGSTVLTPTTEIDDLLEVSVPAELLAAAGATTVTVENQHPTGNITSNAAAFQVVSTAKTLTLTPASDVLDGTGVGITVTSSQSPFVPGAIVTFNGVDLTTTYNHSGSLSAGIAANNLPAAGTYAVTVRNPDGTTFGPATFTLKNPKPVFNGGSFISHGIALTGQSFTLRIDGTGYVPGMTLQLNGEKLVPAIIDGTRLEVVIPAHLIPVPPSAISTDPGLQVDFTVSNPLPNAGVTPGFFRVKNPVPTLNPVDFSDLPPAVVPFTQTFDAFGGGLQPQVDPIEGTFAMRLTGTGFVPGVSRVGQFFNDDRFTTTFVSSMELLVTIPTELLADAQLNHREFPLQVFNPGPGGGASNLETFRVDNPAPRIQSLSHAFVNLSRVQGESADDPSLEITITGTDFTPYSEVVIDGPSETYHIKMVSRTESEIRFRLTKLSPLSTDPGTASIRVVNPVVLGSLEKRESNALPLVVLRPRPEILSVSRFTDTDGIQKLLITGTEVDENTIVEWNGEALTTEVHSLFDPGGSFKATRAGGITAAPGTVTLRLLNDDGQLSQRIGWSTPVITSTTPTTFEVGLGPVTITVLGENFADGVAVKLSDAPLETTFVSSTELRAVMPVEFLTASLIPEFASQNIFGRLKVDNPDEGLVLGPLLTITRPTAAITSLSPADIVAGSGQFTLNIEGRNFLAGNTTVLFGGQELVTSVSSSSRLSAVVPAGFITEPRDLQITVLRTDPGSGILGGSANFTVRDNRGFSITAVNASKPEGNSATSPFSFTVTRTGTTTSAASVNFTVSGSGANPASADDFAGGSFLTGILNFAPNETSRTILVHAAGDSIVEAAESFTVTLSDPVGGNLVTPAATSTIANDDASYSIAATSAEKLEGNTGNTPFAFTVTRAGATTTTGGVKYAVLGSGTNPAVAADFASATGTANFAAGEVSKTITINVKGETAFEPDEGFTVTLNSPTNGSLGQVTSANGTILNDDTRLVIAATDAIKPERTNGSPTIFTFTVTREGNLNVPSTVKYAVAANGSGAAATSAKDFVGGKFPSGVVSFAAGEASKVIELPVLADAVLEGNEGFKVTLSAPTGATLGPTPVATGVIQNDDSVVSIAATSANKIEGSTGSTPFTFTVARAGDTSSIASVNYAVIGTAKNGADAADFGDDLPSGTVEFTANETTKLITIDVLADTIGELNEGFVVTLSNPTNTVIGLASASGAIINDDTSFSITPVNATSANKAEGSSTSNPPSNTAFTFTVTRIGLAVAGSVQFAVTGSGGNSADADDFANASLPAGTLTFAATKVTQTVTINVRADRLVEASEGFTVTLANPTGATLARTTANGMIVNDDSSFAIAAADANKAEGNSGLTAFTFTVTREGVTNVKASVKFVVIGHGASATVAADFGTHVPTNTVSFAAGETAKVITINVKGDTTTELDEGFTVTLSSPSTGATLLVATALGTILNDD